MNSWTNILPVILLTGCAAMPVPPPAPPLVGTVPATAAAGLIPAVSYVGTLAGDVEVDLAFKLPGRIERIGPAADRDWREGDAVVAGQELARLDTAELTEVVRAAQARALNDAALHERGSRLVADALLSQQDFDRLTAARDASAADLRKAQAALAESALAAPFAGTILRRGARAGETVAAGHPVLRLADLRRMSVELGVPEHLVARLRPGQELAMTVSALAGAALRGTVSEVGASAVGGTRLFRVRIAVDNPDGRLRPGMSATVSIPGDAPPEGTVLVPLSALLAAADGRSFHVFVAEMGTSRRRPVQVVDVVGSAVLVTGLAPGDPVVAVGAGLCADGLAIAVRPHDPQALYRRR